MTFHLHGEVFDGYTLFTPMGAQQDGATTYLINNDHEIIMSWSHEKGPARMPYLIAGDEPGWEHTQLIYPHRVENPTMEAGGVGGGGVPGGKEAGFRAP